MSNYIFSIASLIVAFCILYKGVRSIVRNGRHRHVFQWTGFVIVGTAVTYLVAEFVWSAMNTEAVIETSDLIRRTLFAVFFLWNAYSIYLEEKRTGKTGADKQKA